MARTLIAPTNLAESQAVAPVENAVDQANGMYLAVGVGNRAHRVVLEVVNSAGAAADIIIRKGTNPPALRAAIGDLAIEIGAGATRAIVIEGSRHVQNDGTVNVDFEAGFAGIIVAYKLPDGIG